MIEASVMRTVWNDDKISYEVKAKGHAGAGKYGQDIVCAAVSVLMQTLANEVEEAARAGTVALGAVADHVDEPELPQPRLVVLLKQFRQHLLGQLAVGHQFVQ